MLNLEKHISSLLYQYDCVIIPGLGGFVAHNISANINEKTGVFSPPKREIGFNRSLSHNDGLLINHIAKSEGLSYESCQDKINKHVNVLKFQLSKGEILDIANVGQLKTDINGNIIFISGNEHSFAMNSFGLTTFHFNSLKQISEEKHPSRKLVRRTLQSKSIRQIAASITLIMGLMFVSPGLDYRSQQSNFFNMFKAIELNSPSVSSIVTDNIEPVEESIVTPEPKTTTELEPQTVSTPKVAPNKYFIIAGSFKHQHQADVFVNRLSNKGMEQCEILHENNGRFRVSIAGYNNKKDAALALNDYRKVNGFSTVWLLTK
jgi:hypothetical protein